MYRENEKLKGGFGTWLAVQAVLKVYKSKKNRLCNLYFIHALNYLHLFNLNLVLKYTFPSLLV